MRQQRPAVLVTTALEESWPSDEPVLFLGEWCRLYSRAHRWKPLDAELVPYHWDDREKLARDHRYVQALNERLLPDIAERLNRLHGVRHSLKYWRLVVGYWLSNFTVVVFDRWEMIRRALAFGPVDRTLRVQIPRQRVVASDTRRFLDLIHSDAWNHALCADLIEGWTDVSVETISCQSSAPSTEAAPAPPGRRPRFLPGFATRLLRWPRVYFLIGTYLPPAAEARLQLRLGQLPRHWTPPRTPEVAFDPEQRRWTLSAGELQESFEEIVRTLIPSQLPTAFVEGYAEVVEAARRLPWPARPRLIWTSNCHFSMDLFKFWAASKTEAGCRLVTGQHGGAGTELVHGAYSYQANVSDVHLTWSGQPADNPSERAVGMFKRTRPRTSKSSSGMALLVTSTFARYAFDTRSTVIAGQELKYLEAQYRFVECLTPAIQEHLQVRLKPRDFEWDATQRWKDRFPDVELDHGASPFQKQAARARLCIVTYNGTTYLESMAMDVPTIIHWDPAHFELCDDAVRHFDSLRRVGVFHETPESAARQVRDVWDDTERWWRSPHVRDAVDGFSLRYCHKPRNLVARLADVLTANAS